MPWTTTQQYPHPFLFVCSTHIHDLPHLAAQAYRMVTRDSISCSDQQPVCRFTSNGTTAQALSLAHHTPLCMHAGTTAQISSVQRPAEALAAAAAAAAAAAPGGPALAANQQGAPGKSPRCPPIVATMIDMAFSEAVDHRTPDSAGATTAKRMARRATRCG
jgi:hypothetical protein